MIHLYLATLLLAFCSIIYELLLGQVLSAFLGNTILRYSVTVGLYMCSMGLGALFLPKKLQESSILGLLKVETALSIVGASSVMLLLSAHALGAEGLLFSILAHGLIIVIGVFTGFEIPLLIAVGNHLKPNSEARVLGIDYIGAFLGAVLFALFFYSHVGIFTTAFVVGLINALVGASLIRFKRSIGDDEQTQFLFLLSVQYLIIALLLLLLSNAEVIELIGIDLYLSTT